MRCHVKLHHLARYLRQLESMRSKPLGTFGRSTFECFLIAVFWGCAPDIAFEEEREKLFGGGKTFQFPAVGGFFHDDEQFSKQISCVGTVVAMDSPDGSSPSPRGHCGWVLTAAHCQARASFVQPGETEAKAIDARFMLNEWGSLDDALVANIRASDWNLHPLARTRWPFLNDVAVVRTCFPQHPVERFAHFTPIPLSRIPASQLASSHAAPNDPTPLRTASWISFSSNDPLADHDNLTYGASSLAQTLDTVYPQAFIKNHQTIGDEQRGAHPGDSGSPSVWVPTGANGWEQLGLLSTGVPYRFSVGMRVDQSSHGAWVRSVIHGQPNIQSQPNLCQGADPHPPAGRIRQAQRCLSQQRNKCTPGCGTMTPQDLCESLSNERQQCETQAVAACFPKECVAVIEDCLEPPDSLIFMAERAPESALCAACYASLGVRAFERTCVRGDGVCDRECVGADTECIYTQPHCDQPARTLHWLGPANLE